MANEDIRCIVKCLINFQDGNLDPSEVKRGEVLDLTEAEFHKFSKSGPKHFELIETKFNLPKHTVLEAEEIEEWKPVGWYAAQLAKEPTAEFLSTPDVAKA